MLTMLSRYVLVLMLMLGISVMMMNLPFKLVFHGMMLLIAMSFMGGCFVIASSVMKMKS